MALVAIGKGPIEDYIIPLRRPGLTEYSSIIDAAAIGTFSGIGIHAGAVTPEVTAPAFRIVVCRDARIPVENSRRGDLGELDFRRKSRIDMLRRIIPARLDVAFAAFYRFGINVRVCRFNVLIVRSYVKLHLAGRAAGSAGVVECGGCIRPVAFVAQGYAAVFGFPGDDCPAMTVAGRTRTVDARSGDYLGVT